MKNLVKNILGIMLIVLVAFSFISCEGPEGIPGNNGVDGNTNITLYLFDGNDFGVNPYTSVTIEDITESEYNNSAWLIYLTYITSFVNQDYLIPGTGMYNYETLSRSYYYVDLSWYFWEEIYIDIGYLQGTGEDYSQIKVIQIVSNDVIDNQTPPLSLTNAVDITDYQAVLDYYGLEE